MRDSRIRVLAHKGLEAHEAQAGVDAARRFERFGLRVETIDGPSDSVWKDLCRKRVYELAFSDSPVILYGEEPLGRPHTFARVPHDGAILAGLMPQRIYHRNQGRSIELEGFNLYYVGAVVSTLPFRPEGAMPYRGSGPADLHELTSAIELCLAHELGHSLLGREPVGKLFSKKDAPERYDENGHCLTPGCLMQNVSSYIGLLRTAVAQKLDFCEGCSDLLSGRVTELRWHAMA